MSGTPFIINSFGRCGTTYLIDVIRQQRSIPHPSIYSREYHYIEWHKHVRHPPAGVPDGVDVAHLFGNPMNSIISLFSKRDEMCAHFPHLPNWNVMHIRNLQSRWAGNPAVEQFIAQCSLGDFLANQVDYFELEDHFSLWTDCQKQNYPILYIKSEAMFAPKNSEEIRNFFKLPGLELIEQKRRSDWANHPLREGLFKMYGRLWERISQQQDISVKPAKG